MLSLFVLFSFVALQAQPEGTKPAYHTKADATSAAKEAYLEGIKLASRAEPAVALSYFERAVKRDPLFVEAHLAMGDAFEAMRDFFKAEAAYEKALELTGDYAPQYWLYLAEVEWTLEKFSEAAEHAQRYLESDNPRLVRRAGKLREFALVADELVRNPVPFDPKTLGPHINTAYSEYFPTLTADGETLLFTRRDGGNDENFYRSVLKDGVWQTAEPLEGVNTSMNEGAQAISADGTWIVFTACNRDRMMNDGSHGECDLYWSQEKNGEWTKPVPFSKAINSSSWESQPTISADGRTIIFASRRPGGEGQEDLWVTTRQNNGRWTQPKNLGKAINTTGKEQTPYLHPDGVTLYFCSDSLPGMGGSDLFMSRMQPDGTWGKPQNIGYPVNTKGNEAALTVSIDGKTAFYASNRAGGAGELDLYAFELPAAVRPLPATYTRIRVTDAQTGNLLAARVDIINLADGEVYTTANVRQSGTALVALPAGKSYAVNVNKKGYLFYSDNFNLTDSATFDQPFLLDVALQPFDSTTGTPSAGKPVVLRNVFFETGSAALRPESTAELNRLVALLEENKGMHIQINGHTDDVGDAGSNQLLSEARAKAVYDFLVQKGILPERLRYIGYGENRPVVPNDNEANRQRNRRTEFEVVL